MSKHKKKINKKTAQNIHFDKKSLERLGFIFSADTKNDIYNSIRQNKAKLIKKRTHRILVYKYNYCNTDLYIVYDKIRKNLVSCYTEKQKWWE